MSAASTLFGRLLRVTSLLLFVDLLDEIAGIAFVGLPDIEAEFGLTHSLGMIIAFTAPGIVATVLEPPLLVLADRNPQWRRALVVGGLLGMGLAMLLAAASPGPWVFAAAMSALWVCNGLGVNLAQATLMDAEPERREQWMARWVFMGTLGDLLAPLLLAALAWVSLGWRAAFALVGVLTLFHAGLLSLRPFPEAPEEEEEEEEEPSALEAVRAALKNGPLLLWLGAVALCGLLDEVFVALASAWLAEAYGATLAQRGLILGLATGGGLIGLVVLERAMARGADPLRWLFLSSLGTAAALLAWLLAPAMWLSAAALVVLELFAAQLYPLAHAQAFRALPGRAAMVEAMQGLFAPVELLAPVALGLVADRFGLGPALALLALQPLGMALIAWRRRRSEA